MAASGSPVFERRMKYGWPAAGPLVVTVHPLTDRCMSSATPRQTLAETGSWLKSARCAAANSQAISDATVEGEKPDCSYHHSTANTGPCAATKFAAGLMWSL